MEYIEFRSRLLEAVSAGTKEGEVVTLRTIPKNNGVFLDGLTVRVPGKNVCPTIYVQEIMERFDSGETLMTLSSEILRVSRECAIGSDHLEEALASYTNFREKVCFRLVNYKKNRAQLTDLPHHKVLDLAMVYYYQTKAGEDVRGTVLIRNSDLTRWHILPEQLRLDAIRNTPLREPVVSCCLTPDEMAGGLTVFTNRSKVFGASVMLYAGVFDKTADRYGADLFVLPSSIHEVLILPDLHRYSLDDLRCMVHEVNSTVVSKTEVLSDYVYLYSLEKRELLLP